VGVRKWDYKRQAWKGSETGMSRVVGMEASKTAVGLRLSAYLAVFERSTRDKIETRHSREHRSCRTRGSVKL